MIMTASIHVLLPAAIGLMKEWGSFMPAGLCAEKCDCREHSWNSKQPRTRRNAGVARLTIKSLLILLTALLLAPLATLHADEPVSLSADHAAVVNHQRRIFFQYDPAADIQRKGGFGSDMDAVMPYVFDAVRQPGRCHLH